MTRLKKHKITTMLHVWVSNDDIVHVTQVRGGNHLYTGGSFRARGQPVVQWKARGRYKMTLRFMDLLPSDDTGEPALMWPFDDYEPRPRGAPGDMPPPDTYWPQREFVGKLKRFPGVAFFKYEVSVDDPDVYALDPIIIVES